MGFYEIHEHYKLNSKKTRLATNYLQWTQGQQELIKGQLPRTHGISYYYARQQLQQLGEEMGLEKTIKEGQNE